VNAEQANLQFPVLGLSADNDVWGFWDMRGLTTCGPQTLRDNLQDNMELVDASGCRWRVEAIAKIGFAEPAWKRLIGRFFSQTQFKIEHRLKPLDPLGLKAVQERVCEAMRAHPLFWCEEDEIETVLVSRMQAVRQTSTVAAIHDLLGLDTFQSY
jgi:hypothetical protein